MPAWWERPGLEIRDGRLTIAGRDAEAIARERGTPVFAYDLVRIAEQARGLESAFERLGQPFRLRLALKAQRDPSVLAAVRELETVGIDAASPGEVRHALAHGWASEEISYTGTNLSDRDLDALIELGVHVNLDLLSQLRRWGRRAPGTTVGIRVNPRVGATRSVEAAVEAHESLYAGVKPTKFGVYSEQLDEALAIADEHGLRIDTVHVHTGDGFLTDDLPRFAVAIERVAAMAERVREAGHPLAEVNAGGGLGVPQVDGDEPLDPDAFAKTLIEHLGPLDVTVSAEPGDYLAKEMGALLAEVVTVEQRDGVWFAGVDAGYNVAPERFIYGSRFPVVAAVDRPGERRHTTVSGNINEGPDHWGEDVDLPELREGDVVAVLNVGSYNQSMYSEHCLRPPAGVAAFVDRI
ncbi:MAG TPA: diaminopimelate decarboxylase [Actinomycetota bacterium]|nr:diaminopimelate decarboxylase [Actinomycetota bacterium]